MRSKCFAKFSAACAGLAFVALVIGLVVSGALTTGPRSDGQLALRQSDEPVSLRERSTVALESAPDRANATPLDGSATPTARVAVSGGSPHAHLARLDIFVRADGKLVAGAVVALQGVGGVIPAPGTAVDDRGRPLTDERGRASVFVRPMVTWYGEVATDQPRWTGEFNTVSPQAGEWSRLEVALEPSTDARCVHVVVVSLPSGAPLGGVSVRYGTSSGGVFSAPDGSFKSKSDLDGRVVVCWPEGVTLRFEAEGHTVRKVTWADAQRPVEQLAHTSVDAAEASDPIEIELAALGSVYGDSLPVWARSGLITLESIQPSSSHKRAQREARPDPLGNWRIDDVPASIGDGTMSAFRAPRDVPNFVVVWNGTQRIDAAPASSGDDATPIFQRHAPTVVSIRNGTQTSGPHSHSIPLGTRLTLGPGEARRIASTLSNDVVELDARVRIDGELARAGMQVALVRRSASSADEPWVQSALRGGGQSDAEELALARMQSLFGNNQLTLIVDADSHVRAPALEPGAYDVRTFLADRMELIDVGANIRTFHRPSAAGVLEIPSGTGVRRQTDEIILRRIK